MDGFEVVEKLQGDDMPMVIFVTAYNEYAVDAFKVHAIDYVLKPIDDDRLHEAVQRAVQHREQEASSAGKEKLVKLVMSMTGESASNVEEMAEQGAPANERWPEKITIKDGSRHPVHPRRRHRLGGCGRRLHVYPRRGQDAHHAHHHEAARGYAEPGGVPARASLDDRQQRRDHRRPDPDER
jgi:hypothetical protein